MAILTRIGINKLLRSIMETGGMTEDIENKIQRILTDFDERESFLKKYGNVYEGEDKDEYDFVENTTIDSQKGEEDYKTKYEEMQQKYLDRFFGGTSEKVEEVKEDTEEDIKRDGTEQTFETLFEKREG